MELPLGEVKMVKASVVDVDALSATKDSVLVMDFEGGTSAASWLNAKNKTLGDQLGHAVAEGDFTWKEGQVLVLYSKGILPVSRLIFAGLGKKSDFEINKVRVASAAVVNSVRQAGIKELAVRIESFSSLQEQGAWCTACLEGAMLAHHKYEVHKSIADPARLNHIILCAPGGSKELASSVQYATIVSSNTIKARDLINTGASDKPPKIIADHAKKVSGKNVKVTAFFKKDLQRMGAGGILAVNRGAAHEPCLLVVEYNPVKKPVSTVALVGKGIVFDAGGLDIKPASGMETMKVDMNGAAAVIHATCSAAELGLPIRVVGIAALTENLLGPEAYKPGDFVKTMSGKTVEILNTDAEGRMVLADALHYAKTFKPDYIVDIATLTGACWIALGSEAAGLFSNDKELQNLLVQAGEETYERVWPLPLFEEYGEYIKSDFADLKNVVSNSPSGGGAITAAKFLENWVDKTQKWAHLDIAGVDWMEAEKDYRPRGATGFGVRLLTRFLMNVARKL